MKVIIVIDSLDLGGAEKDLVTLLSLMDYSKYEINLFVLKQGGIFEHLVPEHVKIIDGTKYMQFLSDSLLSVFFQSFRTGDFRKIIARIKLSLKVRLSSKKIHGAQRFWENMGSLIDKNPNKYDAAIAFSQGFPTYYVADKIEANKKLTVVNIDYSAVGYDRKHDFQFYKKYDKIIVDSEEVKIIMQRTYPELANNIEIVYHILDQKSMERQAEIGESYNDGFDGIRLLTLGRLAAQKGYDMAMEACLKLKQKGLKFRWYVLGEGPIRPQMEDYIKKHDLNNYFILLGAKSNPYPYLKNCDIYVQPSRFEGYGIALAEARILNKPIVSTNFDVVYEQIVDGQNGLIVEMNADAVFEGIYRLMTDESLGKKMIEYLKKEKKGNTEEVRKWENYLSPDCQNSSL